MGPRSLERRDKVAVGDAKDLPRRRWGVGVVEIGVNWYPTERPAILTTRDEGVPTTSRGDSECLFPSQTFLLGFGPGGLFYLHGTQGTGLGTTN